MEPMIADRTEQEKLIELTEKLSTHNTTHGKNVVFWSCKKCHPGHVCEWHSNCRDMRKGCSDGL